MKESDILLEMGNFYVTTDGKRLCYYVWENGPTAATKVATISHLFGMQGVKREIRRRLRK